MTTNSLFRPKDERWERDLSLFQLLDPAVLANPYPFYARLRGEDPVHWDPFLKTWVVTRYKDVITILHNANFSANRSHSPEKLAAMGLAEMVPIAEVMVRQMLFLDPPAHTRIRGLASRAFTPRRVELLRSHIQTIANNLLDTIVRRNEQSLDIIEDIAAPLPAIVTAEMLGVPTSDHLQLKEWSTDFAEMLGNFQHNPERAARVLHSTNQMTAYFRDAVREHREHPGNDLISALLSAEIEGDRFSEEEIVANIIVTMVGGQETTTNLIGNGVLALLRHPDQLAMLRADPTLLPSAIEELLRFESPSQHTARIAKEDFELDGKLIQKGQAVYAVMGAANHDPERFPEPDILDITRKDNRHVAFGWAGHFCFGAPLARLEGHIVFDLLLRRFPDLGLEPGPLVWRTNLGLRGLTKLPVSCRRQV